MNPLPARSLLVGVLAAGIGIQDAMDQVLAAGLIADSDGGLP